MVLGTRSEEYDTRIEAIAKRYSPRVIALLTKIAEICKAEGMHPGEPFEMFDDEYRWSLQVWRAGHEGDNDQSVDISIELAEALAYGDGDGLNWGLNLVEYGGRILGGLTPFNYTDQCWVDSSDDEAIDERFKLIEEADQSTIPGLCEN